MLLYHKSIKKLYIQFVESFRIRLNALISYPKSGHGRLIKGDAGGSNTLSSNNRLVLRLTCLLTRRRTVPYPYGTHDRGILRKPKICYITHLRYFKSPTLGRMKHLDIKHRVLMSDCRPNASSNPGEDEAFGHQTSGFDERLSPKCFIPTVPTKVNMSLMRLMIQRLAA